MFNLEKLIKLDIYWRYLAPKMARRVGYFDAVVKGVGSDNETLTSVLDSIAWVSRGQWCDPFDNFDYLAATQQVSWPPTWHLTGVNDKAMGHASDVKRFISESNNHQAKFSLLSKRSGNALDYDHINILTHPKAVNDHFPKLANWLKKAEA